MIRAEILLPDGEIPLGKALEAMKRFHTAFNDAFITTATVEVDDAKSLKAIVLFADAHPGSQKLIQNSEKRN